jgi:hypothetical protein
MESWHRFHPNRIRIRFGPLSIAEKGKRNGPDMSSEMPSEFGGIRPQWTTTFRFLSSRSGIMLRASGPAAK